MPEYLTDPDGGQVTIAEKSAFLAGYVTAQRLAIHQAQALANKTLLMLADELAEQTGISPTYILKQASYMSDALLRGQDYAETEWAFNDIINNQDQP